MQIMVPEHGGGGDPGVLHRGSDRLHLLRLTAAGQITCQQQQVGMVGEMSEPLMQASDRSPIGACVHVSNGGDAHGCH